MVTISCSSSTSLSFYVESSVSLLSVVPFVLGCVLPGSAAALCNTLLQSGPISHWLAVTVLPLFFFSGPGPIFVSWGGSGTFSCVTLQFSRFHQVGDGLPWFLKSIDDGHLCGRRDQVRALPPRRSFRTIFGLKKRVSIRTCCG